MALIHDPSRLNKRLSIGHIESTQTGQGVSKSNFVEDFSFWAAIWVRTVSQTYQLVGTNLEDTTTVIIRHNSNVTDKLAVKIDNTVYSIVSINSDESQAWDKYDTLTIRKVTR